MSGKRRAKRSGAGRRCSLVLDPSCRLVPLFDPTGIAQFPKAKGDEMGFQVLDNCCQEHIM